MKKLNVKVHSVVDLITNSSTTIYVTATNSTVTFVKDIINLFLKSANSPYTCDDLFTVTLVNNDEYSYDEGDVTSVDIVVKDETIIAGIPNMDKLVKLLNFDLNSFNTIEVNS